MNWLSTKERLNKSTTIYDKSPTDIFMSEENIRKIIKEVFLLHQSNGGKLNYLYFRRILPNIMYKWVNCNKIPNSPNMDIIQYLNKLFIKRHDNLYTFKTDNFVNNYQPLIDTNVYRVGTTLGITTEDDQIMSIRKKGKELMASDYQLIDVWKTQTTEVSSASSRTGNKIPVWQRSMNTRNYDRSGEGYANIDSNEARWDNQSRSYGSAFSDLVKKTQDLYKKNNTFM
jgi:hypothetical protein